MVYPQWLQQAFPSPFKFFNRRERFVLTDEEALEVAAALAEHAATVKEVKLLMGSLTTDSPGTRALCESFKLLRKMRVLCLTNEVGEQRRQQSKEVAKAILSSACQKIYLEVELCDLRVDGEILAYLSRHATLHLHLHGGTITNRPVDLALRSRKLKNLVLMYLDLDAQPTLLTNILDGLRGNKALKSLALKHFTVTNVSGIAGYLRENRSLTSLNLFYSKPLTSGWDELRDVLVEREMPLDLNLSGVRLSDENFGMLLSALEANGQVQSLALIDSDMDRLKILRRLFRILQSNTHLSELTLSVHKIDYRPTLEAFVAAIPFFCALRKLKVEPAGNFWRWTDGLLTAMSSNHSLFEVRVGSNYEVSQRRHTHRPFQYYGLRNRVNLWMRSLPKMLWPRLIARLCRWKDRSIGLSNLSLLLKTRAEILQHAGRNNNKKRHATEEDREGM